jgi:hypothetical protein
MELKISDEIAKVFVFCGHTICSERGFLNLLADRATMLAEIERLKKEAEGKFVEAAIRVMQANPGFHARDYAAYGITADDFERFFSEDMSEAWSQVEKANTALKAVTAERDTMAIERKTFYSIHDRATAAEAELATLRATNKWVDTRLVRFDDTIIFGHGGFDFDAWDNQRWEMHVEGAGSYAVWPSSKTGDRKRMWSMYGTPDGVLALDRYSCEEHARDDAESHAESIKASATLRAGAGKVEATEEICKAIGFQEEIFSYRDSFYGIGNASDDYRNGVRAGDIARKLDAAPPPPP